jgi:hypothetical protein
VIGVLASIAIPTLSSYMVRSKTSEAFLGLKTISDGVKVYFDSEHSSGANHFFPENTGLNPATVAKGSKNIIQDHLVSFKDDPRWSAIGFYPSSHFYYSYAVASDCPPATECTEGQTVVCSAVGDLDADGITSLFQKTLTILSGNLKGEPLVIVNEME